MANGGKKDSIPEGFEEVPEGFEAVAQEEIPEGFEEVPEGFEAVDSKKKEKSEVISMDEASEDLSQKSTELSKEAPSMDSSSENLAPNVPEELGVKLPADTFKSTAEFEAHNRKQDRRAKILEKEYVEKAAQNPDVYLDPNLHKQIRTLFEKEGFENAQTDRFLEKVTGTAQGVVDERSRKSAKKEISDFLSLGKDVSEIELAERINSLNDEEITHLRDRMSKAQIPLEIGDQIINTYKTDHIKNKGEARKQEALTSTLPDPANTEGVVLGSAESLKMKEARDADTKSRRKAATKEIDDAARKLIGTENEAIADQYIAINDIKSQIDELGDSPEDLIKKQELSIQKNELTNKLEEAQKEAGTDRVYDPETGNYLSRAEATEEQLKDDEDVKSLTEGFKGTDEQKLKHVLGQVHYETKAIHDEYTAETIPRHHYSGATVMVTPESISTGPKRFAQEKNEYSFDDADIERAEKLRAQYIDSRKKETALARSVYLNEDVTKLGERGFADKLEIMGGAFLEETGMLNEEDMTNEDLRMGIGKALSGHGVELTEAQKEAMERTLLEEGSAAVGTSLPLMVPMGALSVGLKGLKASTKLGKYAKAIEETMTKSMGKSGKFMYNIMEGSAEGALTFGATPSDDVDAMMGVGEGFMQGALGDLEKMMPKKWGKLIPFMTRVAAGTTGETLQEFGGDYLSTLKKSGYNYELAFEDTFGRDMETFYDKLMVIGITSAMFSTAFNTPTLLAVQNEIEENMPESAAKTEYLKELDRLMQDAPKEEKKIVQQQREEVMTMEPGKERAAQLRDLSKKEKEVDKKIEAQEKDIKETSKRIGAILVEEELAKEKADAKKIKDEEAVKAQKIKDEELAEEAAIEKEAEDELKAEEDAAQTEPTAEEQEPTVLPEEPVEPTEEKQEPTAEEGVEGEPVEPKDEKALAAEKVELLATQEKALEAAKKGVELDHNLEEKGKFKNKKAQQEAIKFYEGEIDYLKKQIEKASKTEKIAPTKAKTKSGLGKIMDKIFGVKEKKKNTAAVEIADKIIATMARKEGISKKEMYDKISFAKGDKQTTKELKEGRKAKFQGKEGAKNYEAWKGEAQEMEGHEVQQKATTGSPIVIKAHHGTTNTFTEFDSNEKGTSDSHFGKLNYFTTDSNDANQNYAGEGPDLTTRIDMEGDRIAQDLEEEFVHDDGLPNIKAIREEFGLPELEGELSFKEIGDEIARSRLNGGDPKTMDVYVKLNNPAVVGGGRNFVEDISEDLYEDNIPDATEEIMNENDISKEEAESDYSWEIKQRAIENSNIWESPLRAAIQKAVYDNTYDGDMGAIEEAMMDIIGQEYDIDEMAEKLREGAAFAEGEQGELMSGQIVAQTFKNLGYDGIIMKNPAQKFQNMGISPDASHIHVFDEFNNQIKNSDGSNTTYGETADIRFQDERGAILMEETQATIFALTDPDITTPLHELAHLYEKYLGAAEKQAILKWAGHETWTEETSEFFAQGFEQYLKDGKAPNAKMKTAFELFKEWLTDLVVGLPEGMTLNEPMQAIYADMIGEGPKKTTPKKKAPSKAQTELKFQAKKKKMKKEAAEDVEYGIKKAMQSKESISFAEELLERKTPEELFEYAKDLIEKKGINPDDVVDNIVDDPRAATANELAIMMYHTVTLNKQIDKTMVQLEEARQKKNGKDIISLNIELEKLRERRMLTGAAATISGTHQSIAFSIRRFLADSEYSLKSQVAAYEKKTGKPIPRKLKEKYTKLSKALDKNLDNQRREEAKEKVQKKKDFDTAVKKTKTTQGKTTAAKKKIQSAKEKSAEIRSDKKKVRETSKKATKRSKEIANSLRDIADNVDNPLHKALFGDPDLPVQKQAILGLDVVLKTSIRKAADLIEAGGVLIDAINVALDNLRDSDWYKAASLGAQQTKEEQIIAVLEGAVDENRNVQEEGNEFIPNRLAKALVADPNIKDIDDLVDALKAMENYKHMSRNEIMKLVSNYGKTSKLSKDKIDKKLRKFRRIGKLLSSLNDIEEGKLPKRSGLQRDKPTHKERELRREIDEAIKLLAPEETDSAQEETVWKAANTKTKARLKNAIADIGKQIADVQKKVDQGESPEKIRDEKRSKREAAEASKLEKEQNDIFIQFLRAKKDELKKAYEEIMGPNEMTEAQRSEAAYRILNKQLADLDAFNKSGTFKQKLVPKPIHETPKLRKIRDQIKKAKAEYEQRWLHKFPPKTEAEKAIDRRYSALLRTEKKLENELSGIKPNPKNPTPAVTKKEQMVKDRIADLRSQIAETDIAKEAAEKKRRENLGKRLEKKIATMEERIKNKDFAPKGKPKEVDYKGDSRLVHLKRAERKIKREFDKEKAIYEYESRDKWQKRTDRLIEISALPKTLKATLDMSGFFRQGDVFIKTMNPGASLKIFKEMHKFFVSQKNFDNWHESIEDSEFYDLAMDSGLFIADPNDPKALAREEMFQSRLLSQLKLKTKLTKSGEIHNPAAYIAKVPTEASDRAYSGVLNMMRWNMWEKALKSLEASEMDPNNPEHQKAYEAVAAFINTATGRAGLWKFEQWSTALTALLWAPRLIAARLNMFNPRFYYAMPAPARKWALGKAVQWFATDIAMAGIMRAIFGGKEGDDDEVYFEVNPLSSDFLKLRAYDVRYDFFGGFGQYIRAVSQQARQQKIKTSTGERQHFGRDYGGPTAFSEGFQFFANKAAPLPGTFYRKFLTRRENYDPLMNESSFTTQYGDDISYLNTLLLQMAPLTTEEIYSMWGEVNAFQNIATIVATFYGQGAQHYSMMSGPLKRQYQNVAKRYAAESRKDRPDPAKLAEYKELMKEVMERITEEAADNAKDRKENKEEIKANLRKQAEEKIRNRRNK